MGERHLALELRLVIAVILQDTFVDWVRTAINSVLDWTHALT